MNRRVVVVTGGRSDYGLLYWLMREIDREPSLDLLVAATGMHLSARFGHTVDAIEADGFTVHERVECLVESDPPSAEPPVTSPYTNPDTPRAMVRSTGLAVIGFSDALSRLDADMVVVLGDRFEIFAAVQAAYLMGIPVAHISGGEVTEGALDDGIRHAVTKLSHWHFTATEAYRRRVIQLGESPERVFNVGEVGLETLRRLDYLSVEALSEQLGLALGGGFFLVTHHPTTAAPECAEEEFSALTAALDRFPEKRVVFTKSNADAGGRRLGALIDDYARTRVGRVGVFTSLGSRRYLSLLKACDAVLGNSSSGIVEAPSLGVPTVNLGDRQKGRIRAAGVIDVAADAEAIGAALRRALDPRFRREIEGSANPYEGTVGAKALAGIIARLDLPVGPKVFHDVEFSP